MSKLVLEKNILPNNWELVKISDVSELIRGVTYKKSDSTKVPKSNLIGILRATNIKSKLTFENLVYVPKKYVNEEQLIKKNDVIISMSSGSKHLVGKSSQSLNNTKVSFGTFCACLRPLNKINGKYFGYFFKSDTYSKSIQSKSLGVNINNLRREHVENLEIPIPPFNEQKRIVERIEELFSKINLNIENITKVIYQLSIYRLSLLDSAFTVVATKESLSDCGEIGTGGTQSRAKPEYYGDKYPWVKTAEVKNNVIYETSEKITQLGLDNSNAKIYTKNSIILAMYGEGKNRGRCSILGIPASTNQACAVIVCNPEKLFYKYCFYWFQSQYQQIRLKSSGGNQPNLNLEIVKKFKIPLPNISIQEEIVNNVEIRLSQLDNLKDKSTETILYLQNMKNAILKLAFEGKLVPQDSNDEPAEILFQKIKLEKEQLKQKEKSKKRKKNGR